MHIGGGNFAHEGHCFAEISWRELGENWRHALRIAAMQ